MTPKRLSNPASRWEWNAALRRVVLASGGAETERGEKRGREVNSMAN